MRITKGDIKIIAESVRNRLISEGFCCEEDAYEETNWFELYKNDYEGEGFDVNSVTEDVLVEYCEKNDFLYIIDMPSRGWRISAANSREIREEIVSDIYNYGAERTHEADKYLESRKNEFDNLYVVVFKVPVPNDEYYVVWQADWGRAYGMD